MKAARLVFWSGLATAVMLSTNAQAAFIDFNVGVVNQEATSKTFSFTFSKAISGFFNAGGNSVNATVTAR